MLAKSSKAAALLSAVDPRWRDDPGYLFARIEHLRHQEKIRGSGKAARRCAARSGETDQHRRVVERAAHRRARACRPGQVQGGLYEITSRHSATERVDVVDAEFHAGWYALRHLQDPSTAAGHFRKILQVSDRPLSASRAWYWLGRTSEVAGDGQAQGVSRQGGGLCQHLLRSARRRPVEEQPAGHSLSRMPSAEDNIGSVHTWRMRVGFYL